MELWFLRRQFLFARGMPVCNWCLESWSRLVEKPAYLLWWKNMFHYWRRLRNKKASEKQTGGAILLFASYSLSFIIAKLLLFAHPMVCRLRIYPPIVLIGSNLRKKGGEISQADVAGGVFCLGVNLLPTRGGDSGDGFVNIRVKTVRLD
jgi:hypothetical protein